MLLVLALGCVFSTGGDDSSTRPDKHSGVDDTSDTGDGAGGGGGGAGGGGGGGGGDTEDSAVHDTDTSEFCAEALSEAPPAGPDCYEATLGCGDEVAATNAGGDASFEGDDYTGNFCFANLSNHDYDAPERVWFLDLPADMQATVTLESPCVELDLAVAKWTDADTCPTSESSFPVCEGDDDDGDGAVTVSWDSDTTWAIIVDGPYDTELGNFKLRVDCTAI